MTEISVQTFAHPRLFFSPADREALREKRTADPFAAGAWGRIEQLGRSAMQCPPAEWLPRWEWDKGESGLESLGGSLMRIAHLAAHLAFAAFLNEDRQAARKATDLVLSVCQMDYWTGPAFFQPPYDPPWRATLDTAGIVEWVAFAYDWLHGFLSAEEKDRIRLAISYKGIMPLVQDWADPSTRLPIATHIKPWGNWWVNCIAPAGAAALAVYGEEKTVRWETGWATGRPETKEEPLSSRWVRLAKEAMDWFWRFEGGTVPKLEKPIFWDPEGTYYPANFDSEGAYAEGLNYLDMVMIHAFRFTDPYLRMLGKEILPLSLMRKVADFVIQTCHIEAGGMRAANFDDTRAGHATSMQLTAFLARKLRHTGMQWYLNASMKNLNDNSRFAASESPVFTFLWYDPSLAAVEPRHPRPVKVYPGCGWAVMRTGWGLEDTFVALKCGNTAGHAHADAGSFMLHHRGKPLLVDSGTSSYVIPEWHTYYHTTRAHNTVMVGGKGQVKKLAGAFVGSGQVRRSALVAADAAAPYEGVLSRFVRRMAFVRGRYYVVIDELARKGKGRFEWLVHYQGTLASAQGQFIIDNDGSKVLVSVVEPQRVVYSIEQGFLATPEDLVSTDTPEQKRAQLLRGEYLKISPAVDRARQSFVAVLFPMRDGEMAPTVSAERGKGWIALRVNDAPGGDLILVRGAGARDQAPEGFQTDARVVVAMKGPHGEITELMIEGGTYLRLDGRTISLRKAAGTISCGPAS